jgi:DNA polymerase V
VTHVTETRIPPDVRLQIAPLSNDHPYTVFMNSVLPLSEIRQAECLPVALLWIEGSVKAGFPSPALEFDCKPVDLATILIRHPQATFLIRASGLSMLGAGINDGDLLVIDRALEAHHGSIVCAVVDAQFTVKYLHRKHGKFRLVAADPTIPDIVPRDGQTVEIWGVVTASITRLVKL